MGHTLYTQLQCRVSSESSVRCAGSAWARRGASIPVYVTLPTPDLSALPVSTCGPETAVAAPAWPLPSVVTGRTGFYAAVYDTQFHAVKAVGLGPVNALFPLGSAFKPQVVRAALEEVDAGRLNLNALITTTPGKRGA